jgi:hypothetical protein
MFLGLPKKVCRAGAHQPFDACTFTMRVNSAVPVTQSLTPTCHPLVSHILLYMWTFVCFICLISLTHSILSLVTWAAPCFPAVTASLSPLLMLSPPLLAPTGCPSFFILHSFFSCVNSFHHHCLDPSWCPLLFMKQVSWDWEWGCPAQGWVSPLPPPPT